MSPLLWLVFDESPADASIAHWYPSSALPTAACGALPATLRAAASHPRPSDAIVTATWRVARQAEPRCEACARVAAGAPKA